MRTRQWQLADFLKAPGDLWPRRERAVDIATRGCKRKPHVVAATVIRAAGLLRESGWGCSRLQDRGIELFDLGDGQPGGWGTDPIIASYDDRQKVVVPISRGDYAGAAFILVLGARNKPGVLIARALVIAGMLLQTAPEEETLDHLSKFADTLMRIGAPGLGSLLAID